MQTIGNYLKSGREARNIRLSEVARSTKISKWYLDCLEKDEFDKIPGGPYIKGYIASYASYIGIEEDEILKRYDSLQINSDDENEVQEHLLEDKKKQKSPGLSFSKKKLLILSMVIFILLAFGIKYFFFQNQSHIVTQLQDAQNLKTQPTPASKLKQSEAQVVPNNLTSIKAKAESQLTHQDAAGTESQALLPSGQDLEGKLQPVLSEKKPPQKKITTGKATVINNAPSSSEKNNIERPALTDSKTPLHQDTPVSEDLDIESALVNEAPPAQTQMLNDMRIIRAVAANEVINKNPAGPTDSFQWSTEKVYIWTMIECDRPPSSIRHIYYFKGQKVNDVVLKVKSPQWRTWSYKTLLDKRYIGQWRVDITSDEGNILQSVFFEVN